MMLNKRLSIETRHIGGDNDAYITIIIIIIIIIKTK